MSAAQVTAVLPKSPDLSRRNLERMRLPGILLSFAALAFLPGPVWPSDAVSIPKALRSGKASRDPFGNFLGELRLSQDTLNYRLGQQALDRQRYDSALGHHLAAD